MLHSWYAIYMLNLVLKLYKSSSSKEIKSVFLLPYSRYVRMGLTVKFREEIGRKTKQIIDMGRVRFLKSFDINASLIEYVDRSLTLENIAIVARPRLKPTKVSRPLCSF